MRRLGRLAALISVLSFLLFHSSIAGAYVISIVGDPTSFGGNLSLTTTANRISLSDFFNQYDETRWEIASAQQDGSGVQVTYNYPVYGTWDSYGAFVDLQFQILSESGDLTPEPVAVDVWGSSFYRHEMSNACCFSEPPEVEIQGASAADYSATPGAYTVLAETNFLLSNTTYTFNYFNSQYVEATPDHFPPSYFSSWDEYNSFVASNGSSGVLYASAFGFMNYNLALRPQGIPEPGTLALFAVALAGLGLAKRRKHA